MLIKAFKIIENAERSTNILHAALCAGRVRASTYLNVYRYSVVVKKDTTLTDATGTTELLTWIGNLWQLFTNGRQ
jgi:hypothetical protein